MNKILLFFPFLFFIASACTQDDFFQARKTMIEEQIIGRGIKDKKVLAAIQKVPRHAFVPDEFKHLAHRDGPLPIGHGQTISQPYIVALMTELLKLKGGEKILEIGTGSGYQAAVLAEIVKNVYTLEIVEPLAQESKKRLWDMGYNNVLVEYGDGFMGWEEYAPFDAIIVTCAPKEVPQPLINQLKEGGRLVIPVGDFQQELKVLTKKGDFVITEDIIPVRFVPMTRKRQNVGI